MATEWFCTKCEKVPDLTCDTFPPFCGYCGTQLVDLDEHLESMKKDLENKLHAEKKKDWRGQGKKPPRE